MLRDIRARSILRPSIQVIEAGKPQMSELWAKWEGEVINGGLPLRRLVGVTDHSGVFLTEAPAYGLPNAAIKLVPAIPTLAESQLAHWNTAAGLAHPRLLRLFAMGRCQLPGGPVGQGNLHFLYVLMEYADQNLAQLLENRALTDVEARETLPATLDALAFLHSRNMVQGQLKPSNILVVGDQLKLASDTIRPAGELATSISMSSAYDPPEGTDGSISTAGDIWALGVTLFEALTRATPAKPDERSHGVVLPADFPPTLADVTRECLSRRPADRPSVTALQDWVSGKVKYRGAPSAGEVGVASAGVAVAEPSARSGAAGGAGYGGQRATALTGSAATDADGTRAGAAATGASYDSRPATAGAAATGVAREGQRVSGGPAESATGAGYDSRAAGAGAAATGVARDGQRVGGGPAGSATGAGYDSRSASLGAEATGVARDGQRVSGLSGSAAGADRAPNERGASQAAAFSSASAAQSGAARSSVAGVPGKLTIRAVVEREPIEEELPARPSYTPWVVAGIAILAIGWGAVRLLGGHSTSSPQSTNTESTNASPPAPQADSSPAKSEAGSQASRPAPADQATPPAASEAPRHSSRGNNPTRRGSAASDAGPGSVAHEEIPVVPRSALATIHGRIKVVVRVTADESGNVISDNLDHPGPSHYFAKLATQAASKWKFVPEGHKSGGVWLIHFEFARTGVTAHATGAKS